MVLIKLVENTRMRKETYSKIENYMLEMMTDAAHDCLHIYRVADIVKSQLF